MTALLEQWIRVWNESPGSEKAYAQYLALLQQHGVPQMPDLVGGEKQKRPRGGRGEDAQGVK